MAVENLICKICGNAQENKIYTVREMMYKLGEEFEYFQCNSCGCLQIKALPENMPEYYPLDYYSFGLLGGLESGKGDNCIKRYLRHKRVIFFMYEKGILGKLLSVIKPLDNISKYLAELKKCNARFDSKILDVGSGNGNLLLQLARCGFRNLQGIDLYIEEDIIYPNGISVFKKNLDAVKDTYDMLMFHHSLEHMEDQLSALRNISRLLNDDGCAIVRIPLVSSYAWEHYGVHWVQIDAPRHFFLHSLKSIQILSEKAALKIKEVTFDSTEFQFIGSEQYTKDIPLSDARSYYRNPKKNIFNSKEVRLFQQKAAELNNNKFGDQACFYLVKN